MGDTATQYSGTIPAFLVFPLLLKHYNQAFEQKFQNHNAIFKKAHPFP